MNVCRNGHFFVLLYDSTGSFLLKNSKFPNGFVPYQIFENSKLIIQNSKLVERWRMCMAQVSFAYYSEPKKMRCECCDRSGFVEVKMFVSQDKRLVGDLDLCAACGELLREVTAKSKVEKEWSFGGGEILG